jgi:hypothetical protein
VNVHIAVIVHGCITLLIKEMYPEATQIERDRMFIEILERLARMRGWAIRPDFFAETDGE